jgi:hypothetical protein
MSYFYKGVDITTYIGLSQDINAFTQSSIDRTVNNPSTYFQGIDKLYLAGSNSNIEKLKSNTSAFTYGTQSTQLTSVCIPPFIDITGSNQVTKPSWANHCSIICVGGGAGGAGGSQGFQRQSGQNKNSQDGAGSGGGGGGGISYLINTNIQGVNSLTVTVGSGGQAGSMDQTGNSGQISKVQWQSSEINANGGGIGTIGTANGGLGGSGGVGGTGGGTGAGSNFTSVTGTSGQSGGNTGQTSRVQGGTVNNNKYPTYIPSLSQYGSGGSGGGCGNSNGPNPSGNTPGLSGTGGIIRVYWLTDILS